MPKITAITIQEKRKNRCNLFVDGQFFAGVSVETAIKNRLKVGVEIEEKALKELLDENERAEALNKAVEYVSKSLKTKRQVKDYLLKKGYIEDVVWYCIDKLKEYDYIDDCEYIKRYIESVSKTQGKKLVEYKLMAKGVKKQDIASAMNIVKLTPKKMRKLLHKNILEINSAR